MDFSNEFTAFRTPKGILIPNSALELGHIASDGKAKLHLMDHAIVVTKDRMTAMELLTVVDQLQTMAAGLLNHLAKVCGPCDDCESSMEGHCPYGDLDEEPISLPGYLRQEAGIPEDIKLCAEVNEENNSVTLTAAEHRYDLTDLPRDLLDDFAAAGICLGELEEHLILEDVVYGEAVR